MTASYLHGSPMTPRAALAGSPHTYLVEVVSANAAAVLASSTEQLAFAANLEAVRACFSARIFSFALHADRIQLVLRHQAERRDGDEALRARWQALYPGRRGPATGWSDRFTTLAGFMQVLLQRYGRERHERTGGSGRQWAHRYRAVLLSDDRALLAISGAVVGQATALWTSLMPGPVRLASLPLRGEGALTMPADEAPPGMPPASLDPLGIAAARVTGPPADLARTYAQAMRQAWAIGQPESLHEVLARLGRATGKGRRRRLHELDDALGLCAVWG